MLYPIETKLEHVNQLIQSLPDPNGRTSLIVAGRKSTTWEESSSILAYCLGIKDRYTPLRFVYKIWDSLLKNDILL
ncbi:hypothetical protein [Mesobacillus maritimus]|uniref:hypothetical protein n=1 Tax=Mesobacillus maritimus TaxID=1643336 RepID=UPI003D816524